MSSNSKKHADDRNVIKLEAEIKEEKVDIVDSCNETSRRHSKGICKAIKEKASSSTGMNTNDLDKFIKTLSYDEIISSIEIVQQLQQALLVANERESEEECAKNDRKIKQEKVLQNISASYPEECLKGHTSLLQGFSGPFKSENENISENRENGNSSQACSDIVSSRISDLFQLLQSDTESPTESASFNYKGAETICHLKEESLESKSDLDPFALFSNHYEGRYLSPGENVSKNTVIIPDRNACNFVPITSNILCKSDSKNITCELNKIETVSQPLNQTEKHGQQPLIGNAVSEEMNIAKGENNLCRGKEMKYCLDKQIMKTKSKRKQKKAIGSATSFSFSELKTKTFDPPENKRQIRESEFSPRSNLKNTGAEKFSKFKRRATENIQLEVHTKTFKGEKLFDSKMCSYKCTTRSGLKKHLNVHIGEKPYKYEMCSYESAVHGNLKQHMLIDADEKPYACNMCSYRYNTRSGLKTHILTHTGEKPYKCKMCSYKCTTSSRLKSHILTHTGEKPYKCKMCSYKGTTSGGLKAHVRTHTGEKPYKCKICSYESAECGNLKKHLLTHTGEKPYKCKMCSFESAECGNLKKHLLTHTSEKPYKCEMCSYDSAQYGNLKKHILKHM